MFSQVNRIIDHKGGKNVKISEYKKIQEYRELGLSQKKTAEKMRLTLYEVRGVWTVTEEEFCRLSQRTERNIDKQNTGGIS